MALLTNALSSLISAGNDAQGNLYRVTFDGGRLPSNTEALTIRLSGFTPPEASQDAYTVKYITAFIDRPKTKVNLDRSFPLEFRMDDYWETYKALLEQQKVTMNAAKSYVNTNLDDIKDDLFNVHVDIIDKLSDNDEESNMRRLFNFRHCWVESITPPKFSTSGSEPIKVSCKINFIEMDDWQSGLSTSNADETGHKKPMMEEVVSSTRYV